MAHRSAAMLLFNIFHQFLIITPAVEIKNPKAFYQSCLADSHQTDSSIMPPLHLSLTLIRNPFQMSSQFLFSRTKRSARNKKEERGQTPKDKKSKRLHVKVFLHTVTAALRHPKFHSPGNNYSSISITEPLPTASDVLFMSKVIVYLAKKTQKNNESKLQDLVHFY